MLPRLQLFEFNDAAWAPAALRRSIIESLSVTLDRARVLKPLVAPFADFLEQTRAQTVIELASGAGGPARIFIRELQAAGVTLPRFVLSDLYPAVDAWQALQQEFPGVVEYEPEPVDATAIPPRLVGVRTIINALHHFPPELAQRVLLGACEGASGVFVAEGLVRNPLSFAAMAPSGVLALMRSPLNGSTTLEKLQRAMLTWLTPASIAASVWDGTVSSMRCYSEHELREMVKPLGDSWEWKLGHFQYNALGRGTWFSGVRRQR